MGRTPSMVTICTDCKREDVGVVLDWASRDKSDRMLKKYRVARHSTKYGVKGAPICVGSRAVVAEENIFENNKEAS